MIYPISDPMAFMQPLHETLSPQIEQHVKVFYNGAIYTALTKNQKEYENRTQIAAKQMAALARQRGPYGYDNSFHHDLRLYRLSCTSAASMFCTRDGHLFVHYGKMSYLTGDAGTWCRPAFKTTTVINDKHFGLSMPVRDMVM